IDGDFELSVLAKALENQLPTYARPIFLRILPEPDLTGTFKHQKARLKKEAYSLELTDSIYIRDAASGNYEDLNQELTDALHEGARI
ncbi:MAG: long-chain-acyl-CoA synthetase, partial [Deltaproteobacteria bacterium]|nr:long-chain-acyl-CoA synthetase [Deltaproteobacteria bacterium]